MDLASLPDRRATTAAGAPCVDDDDRTLDNAAFFDAVRRAATTLHEHGVGAGDVVAVILPNTVDLVVTLFAAWRLGAAVTPLNPALSVDEATYQIADAAATVLVTDVPREIQAPVTVLSPAQLRESTPAAETSTPVATGDSLALLIYTSGTTGRPKGVMLDHANLDAMCRMVIDNFALTSADHSLLILPLFHVNGIVVSTLSPLLAGGQASIAGRFDPRTFFDRVERSGATYFSGVPTIFTMLADLPTEGRPDTSMLRFAVCGPGQCGTARPVRKAVSGTNRRRLRALGMHLRQHRKSVARQA